MSPDRVSHYRLTERLGAGTYGEVWKGVHVDDPAFMVAVKLVSPHVREDPSFVEALRGECRALDRMDHPSIVRFRELVVRDGVVAMVMELLEGSDLEGLLARGPQPVDEVVRILERVLDGLAYAHEKGVMHRDIKPGNLFRCTDGRVKLMDFGIARAADGTTATRTGTVKGTLDYMAPERFRNHTTPASDVYAVGLVVWELLTGRRAAPEGDLPTKMGWHLMEGVGDVRTERPDCPTWLAAVVAALTARQPVERPEDGSAARKLLTAARKAAELHSASPSASPPRVVPETVTLNTTPPPEMRSASSSTGTPAPQTVTPGWSVVPLGEDRPSTAMPPSPSPPIPRAPVRSRPARPQPVAARSRSAMPSAPPPAAPRMAPAAAVDAPSLDESLAAVRGEGWTSRVLAVGGVLAVLAGLWLFQSWSTRPPPGPSSAAALAAPTAPAAGAVLTDAAPVESDVSEKSAGPSAGAAPVGITSDIVIDPSKETGNVGSASTSAGGGASAQGSSARGGGGIVSDSLPTGSSGSGGGGGGSAAGLGAVGTKGRGSGSFGKKGSGGLGKIGGDPIFLGALDKSLIDAVIKRHMNQIQHCYTRELTKTPKLGGKVIVKFVIAKDGSVSKASIKSSSMGSKSVEGCITSLFMRFKFPEPKGGGIVIVSYPFIFAP